MTSEGFIEFWIETAGIMANAETVGGNMCLPYRVPTLIDLLLYGYDSKKLRTPSEYASPRALKDDDDFEECPDCGGEGWVVADCFEDTCCCADPDTEHGLVRCSTCEGEG